MTGDDSSETPQPTIIDLLEHALDGDLSASAADRLSLREIAELAESVQDFYDVWQPPAATDGDLRVHLGGWVAGNLAQPGARTLLNTALLYAHEVLVHDPIAAYFEPRRKALRGLPPVHHRSGMQVQSSQGHIESTGGWVNHTDLEGARSHLGQALEGLAPLAPLLRSRAVIAVPHLRAALAMQERVLTAVRHSVRDEDFQAAVENPIDGPVLTSDEPSVRVMTEPVRSRADVVNQNFAPAAFYLARTLAVANAYGASYLPPSATDWGLYENRITSVLAPELRRRDKLDLKVISAVSRSELPLAQGLDSETLVRVHEDEGAFEAWRSALRRAVRQIEGSASGGEDFVEESREVLEDELGPLADEVRRAVTRSQVLRERFGDAKFNLSAGVATASGAALAGLGTPASIGTAAVSGLGSWLLGALFPRRQAGAKAVVAHLLNASGQPGALPRPDEAVVLRPR